MTTTRLSMENISEHASIQPRSGIKADVVRRYAAIAADEGARKFPPIAVTNAIWSGVLPAPYIVIDGHHRFRAFKKAGIKKIDVELVEAENEDDARWKAVARNQSHGLPLDRKQDKEVFHRYISAGAYKNSEGKPKSLREMAAELGHIRKHTTIRTWIQSEYPEIFREIARTPEDIDDDEEGEPLENPEQYAASVRLRQAVQYLEYAVHSAIRNDLLEEACEELSALRQSLELDWETQLFIPFEERPMLVVTRDGDAADGLEKLPEPDPEGDY